MTLLRRRSRKFGKPRYKAKVYDKYKDDGLYSSNRVYTKTD